MADLKVQDPRWRLNHLYKISTKAGQLETFQENLIQKRINDLPSKKKMILKYRQGGVSTNELLKMLDYVSFNQNRNACILSHEQDSIEKLFRVVRLAHDTMERWKPRLDKGGGSMYEMRFPLMNSRIFCDLESRSEKIDWLHISEAAFADPDRVRATTEAVPVGGIITYETTPNGLGNHFYKKWIEPSLEYKKLFFPWVFQPEYIADAEYMRGTEYTEEELEFIKKTKELYSWDVTKEQIAFRRLKREALKELYYQEYPEDDKTCFLSHGGSIFNLITISKMLNAIQPPIEDDGVVQIYKRPITGMDYVAGADTAEGVGGDYSVCTIYEARTFEQCAQVKSNTMRPRQFAHAINNLCKRYLNRSSFPLLAVEANNHGHAVLLELDEHIGYPNLYRYKDDRLGWRTDSISRPLLYDGFIDGVETGRVKLNSRDTLNECLTLINNEGKIEAATGEHDDTIIASAIAIQMCIEGAYDTSRYAAGIIV